MKQYMLSKNGSELGPFHLNEVVAKITSREIELFDYIYDDSAQDWILLTEHPEITQALKAKKPKAPPKVQQREQTQTPTATKTSSPHDIEWFVMKGESQFGPFSSGDLLRLMQEKTVFEFDFVWNASMKDWQRIAEIPDFTKEKIQSLAKNPEMKESFFERQHERTPLKSKIIVHNGNDYWLAEGKEISEGGMGLYIKDAMIVPGQVLSFHVKGDGNKPPFNIKGEIVSKQYKGDARHRNERIEYGVKFLKDETQAAKRVG